MLTWIFLHNLAANHSLLLEYVVLIASCIPVLLTHREFCEKIKKAKKFRKWRLVIELSLLWLLPVLVFVSSKASDWASENRIRVVESEAKEARNSASLLEKLEKPRTINGEQKKKFMALLKGYPRIHIKVFCHEGDNETWRYASQIREMLNENGYGTNGEQVIETPQYAREWAGSPYPFSKYDLACFWYGTNRTERLIPEFMLLPGGKMVGVMGKGPYAEFSLVILAFWQIQIFPAGGNDDTLLKPGEFGVFVPPKIH
jgi:hypothetical protein